MPVLFNPIAFAPSLPCEPQLELAGTVVARTFRDAVRCPYCGASYHLLVPAAASHREVETFCLDLGSALSASCGMHPPFVQMP
jgi:hypothetical protein